MELLAPAGSPEALTAAVQAGADAVYLGYGSLNARRNAKNFSQEELAQAVDYCHLRGTKVYLTLNTLLSQRELSQAAKTGAMASDLGIDAVLVQDLGVAKLLRQTCPDLPLHASTQMTVHDLDGVKACADLGMTRVVLSRELSREAIAFLCARSPVELEIFVHGALCMCYSGQCFLSAVVGRRSGNRGLCAQPCRLSYRWPGEKTAGHPLSLKDLSLADHLQELEEMGVACLKIEGRMKRPEYVSVVTGIYAQAMRAHRAPSPEEMAQLEAAFSRQGFTQGYYQDRVDRHMFGTRKEGTKDPEDLFRAARQQYSRGEHAAVPVFFSAVAEANTPLSVTVTDGDGRTAAAQAAPPEPARTRAVTAEQIEGQLKKTGGTVYAAQSVTAQVGPGLSVPLSAVNALRREALAQLDALRTARPDRRTLPPQWEPPIPGPTETPAFSLSFRHWEQLSPQVLDQGPALVYLPSSEWAAHAREAKALISAYPDLQFGVTFPRIVWDRDRDKLEQELKAARDAGVTEALLAHIGQLALAHAWQLHPRGDFGLGLMNDGTAAELTRLGFVSATVSFEAKFSQIRDLSKPLPIELLVYGRLPLMMMEHPIQEERRHPSSGNKTPSLRDRRGEDFPVEPSWGHRSELFNAKVLWLADKPKDWQTCGVSYARLSFVQESAAQCAEILHAYRTAPAEPPADFTRGLYYRGVE